MILGLSVSIGFGTKKRPQEASTALVATRNVTPPSSNSRKGRERSLPGHPTLLQLGIGIALPCGKPSLQNDWGICSSSGHDKPAWRGGLRFLLARNQPDLWRKPEGRR